MIRNWLPGAEFSRQLARPGSIIACGWGREACMGPAARATAWTLSLFVSLAANTSQAADLVWEVEGPFRFFKPSRSFDLHEAHSRRCAAIRRLRRRLISSGAPNGRSMIRIARMARRLTAATAGKRYQQSRLGWAVQTLAETCYESNGHFAGL